MIEPRRPHSARPDRPWFPPASKDVGASALAVAAALWFVLIISAPALVPREVRGEARHGTPAAALPYLLGRVICHQRPERSFSLRGVQLPVCARCSGLYGAAPLGVLAAILWPLGRPSDRRLRAALAAACAPTALTLAAEWSGVWEPSNAARAAAAVPAGAAVAWLLGAVVRGDLR
jgi:uncharacterized membrane protein